MEEQRDDRFTASLSSERKIYQTAKQRREIHSEEASRATEKQLDLCDVWAHTSPSSERKIY